MSCPGSFRVWIVVGVLALAVPCTGAAETAQGKKYALLVGVRKYDSGKFSELKYTENDVEDLEKMLSGKGGFASVRVLSTTRGEKRRDDAPTVDNLRAALKALLAQKKVEDTVLVALSGHGIQRKGSEDGTDKDENFFCPSDAQLNDNDTLLPFGQLFKDFNASAAGLKLLLVDACRNDPKRGANVNLDVLPRPPRGTAALFSCDSGERAFETEKFGKGHGIFFHFVLEGLGGEARNKRGEITWDGLVEHVKDKVHDAVPILIGGGAKQTPHEIKNLKGKAPVLVGAGQAAAVKPLGATVLGGIEIGAKGVKGTVISAKRGTDGLSVHILHSWTYNSTLSAGIASTGKFDPRALKATAAAVKKMAEIMETEHKVPRANIHVVGGSGPFSAIEKDEKAVQARQAELAKVLRDATGQTPAFIGVKQEARLSIVGIVPRRFLDVSLLIDVGSGNTKGGYRDQTKKYVTFDVPYGSVTLGEAMKKSPGVTFEALVRPALEAEVKKHPALASRDRVYLSGGACWAMANCVKPADRANTVALTAKDIDAYHKMLTGKPGEYPMPDLSTLNEKDRASAEKDIARIKKTFTPAQLLAGAEILKALSSEFKLAGEKKLYFARNGYLGWILAYAALKTK